MQRALLQYKNPKNYDLIYEALIISNRQDLIGFHDKALIRPKTQKNKQNQSVQASEKSKKTQKRR